MAHDYSECSASSMFDGAFEQHSNGEATKSEWINDKCDEKTLNTAKTGKNPKDGGVTFLIKTLSKSKKNGKAKLHARHSKRKRGEKAHGLLPNNQLYKKNIEISRKDVPLHSEKKASLLEEHGNSSLFSLSEEGSRPYSKKIIELCDKIKLRYKELKPTEALSHGDDTEEPFQNPMNVTELCDKIRVKYASIKNDKPSGRKMHKNGCSSTELSQIDDCSAYTHARESLHDTDQGIQESLDDEEDCSLPEQGNLKNGSNKNDCQSFVNDSVSSSINELNLHLDVSDISASKDNLSPTDQTCGIQDNSTPGVSATEHKERSKLKNDESQKDSKGYGLEFDNNDSYPDNAMAGKSGNNVGKVQSLSIITEKLDASDIYATGRVTHSSDESTPAVKILHEIKDTVPKKSSQPESFEYQQLHETVQSNMSQSGKRTPRPEANHSDQRHSTGNAGSKLFRLVSCESDELLVKSVKNTKTLDNSNDTIEDTMSFKVIGKLIPSQSEKKIIPCNQMNPDDSQHCKSLEKNGLVLENENRNRTVISSSNILLQPDSVNKMCYRIQTADSSKQLTNLVCLGEERKQGANTSSSVFSKNPFQDISTKEGAIIVTIPNNHVHKSSESHATGKRRVTPILPKPATDREVSKNDIPFAKRRKIGTKQKKVHGRIMKDSKCDSNNSFVGNDEINSAETIELNNQEASRTNDPATSEDKHSCKNEYNHQDDETSNDPFKSKLNKGMSKTSIESYINNLILENESIAERNKVVHYRKPEKVQKSYKKIRNRENQLLLGYKKTGESSENENSESDCEETLSNVFMNKRTLNNAVNNFEVEGENHQKREESPHDVDRLMNKSLLETAIEGAEFSGANEVDAIDDKLAMEIACCVQGSVIHEELSQFGQTQVEVQTGKLSNCNIVSDFLNPNSKPRVSKKMEQRKYNAKKAPFFKAVFAKEALPNHIKIIKKSNHDKDEGFYTALHNVFKNGVLSFNSKGKLRCTKQLQKASYTAKNNIKIVKFRNIDENTCIRISDRASKEDEIINRFAWRNLYIKRDVIGKKRNFNEAFPLQFGWETPHLFTSRRLTYDRATILEKLQKHEIRMQRCRKKVIFKRDLLSSCSVKQMPSADVDQRNVKKNSLKRKFESNRNLSSKSNKHGMINKSSKDRENQKCAGYKRCSNAFSDAEIARLIALRNELGITNFAPQNKDNQKSANKTQPLWKRNEECAGIDNENTEVYNGDKKVRNMPVDSSFTKPERGNKNLVTPSRDSKDKVVYNEEQYVVTAYDRRKLKTGCKKLTKSVFKKKASGQRKRPRKSCTEESEYTSQFDFEMDRPESSNEKSEHQLKHDAVEVSTSDEMNQLAPSVLGTSSVDMIREDTSSSMIDTVDKDGVDDKRLLLDVIKRNMTATQEEESDLNGAINGSVCESRIRTRSKTKQNQEHEEIRSIKIKEEVVSDDSALEPGPCYEESTTVFQNESEVTHLSESETNNRLQVTRDTTVSFTFNEAVSDAVNNSFLNHENNTSSSPPNNVENGRAFSPERTEKSTEGDSDKLVKGVVNNASVSNSASKKTSTNCERRRSSRLAWKKMCNNIKVEDSVQSSSTNEKVENFSHSQKQNNSCPPSSTLKEKLSNEEPFSCKVCKQNVCKCLLYAQESLDNSLSIAVQKCFHHYNEHRGSVDDQCSCNKCGENFSNRKEYTRHVLYHMVDEAVEKHDGTILKDNDIQETGYQNTGNANHSTNGGLEDCSSNSIKNIETGHYHAEDVGCDVENESSEEGKCKKKKTIYKAKFWKMETAVDKNDGVICHSKNNPKRLKKWTPLKLGIHVQPVKWRCLECKKTFEHFNQIKKHASKHNSSTSC